MIHLGSGWSSDQSAVLESLGDRSFVGLSRFCMELTQHDGVALATTDLRAWRRFVFERMQLRWGLMLFTTLCAEGARRVIDYFGKRD